MVTVEDVRALVSQLPRSTEAFVRGRVKFRVGRIVYVAFSKDEAVMGFAFPKEKREWLVGTEPETFLLPPESELRWNWVLARLDAIDVAAMHELVFDAWCMVVPMRVAAAVELDRLDYRPIARWGRASASVCSSRSGVPLHFRHRDVTSGVPLLVAWRVSPPTERPREVAGALATEDRGACRQARSRSELN